jgi:hypothetical protein
MINERRNLYFLYKFAVKSWPSITVIINKKWKKINFILCWMSVLLIFFAALILYRITHLLGIWCRICFLSSQKKFCDAVKCTLIDTRVLFLLLIMALLLFFYLLYSLKSISDYSMYITFVMLEDRTYTQERNMIL